MTRARLHVWFRLRSGVQKNSSFVGAADIIICCRRPAFEIGGKNISTLITDLSGDDMQVAVARANSEMLEYKNWNPLQRLDVLSINWTHWRKSCCRGKAREFGKQSCRRSYPGREEANMPVRLYDWTLCLVLSVHLKRPDNKTSSLTRSPAVPHTRCLHPVVRTRGVRPDEFSFDVALPSTPRADSEPPDRGSSLDHLQCPYVGLNQITLNYYH